MAHARRFLDWLGGDPLSDPVENAKRFLRELLRDRGLSHSYVSQAVSAVKVLYRHVLEVGDPGLRIPRPKTVRNLPVVLSVEEVSRLLAGVNNPKHRAILMVVYSAGLRVGEVVRLKVSDIDSERALIHVRQAKGRKDRYLMLSDLALRALRDYWPTERPTDWLFPGAKQGRHLHQRSVQKVFAQAKEGAGLRKKVSVHSLRHAFATHLLEDGVDIRYIQKLLGHKSTKTTEIYTRVSRRSIQAIRSPLDRLADRGLDPDESR